MENVVNIGDFNILPVGAIVVICFVVGLFAKRASFIDDKWIPVIAAVAGGILGGVAMFVMPSFPVHNDMITAVATGVMSGLTAVGVHQVYKQQIKEE